MKKIIALILVVVSVFSTMSITAYAEEAKENTVTVTVNEVEFVFDADTSEEFRNKFITHYFNHGEEDATTRMSAIIFFISVNLLQIFNYSEKIIFCI